MTGRAKISRRFWHLLSSRERGSRTRVRKVAASGVEVMNATSGPSQLRRGQISGHFRPPISDVRDTEILSSSTVRLALRGACPRRLPFRVVSGVGGEDDGRLSVEGGQGGRLLHRPGPCRRHVKTDPLAAI